MFLHYPLLVGLRAIDYPVAVSTSKSFQHNEYQTHGPVITKDISVLVFVPVRLSTATGERKTALRPVIYRTAECKVLPGHPQAACYRWADSIGPCLSRRVHSSHIVPHFICDRSVRHHHNKGDGT